ncbi:peptide ABC transporter substrate-binding protein [Enterococcus sp. LJL98]
MKVRKVLATVLVSTFVLAACSNGNTGSSNDTGGKGDESSAPVAYTTVFPTPTDLETLDYTVSQRATNGIHFANFVDGLMENDPLGELVPAMAESWEVSEDGLTYTYKIREGVQWLDSEGNEFGAEVTAHDWVTGLKHAVAEKSETLYIVGNSIVGLNDYIEGKTDNFDDVGVKALDDYTLEYTLNQPESFWNSKTTYGILFPINEEFLESKGDAFGQPTPDGILYNGPFILKNNTAKSVIEYEKNEDYWDIDNVHLDTVKFIYNDGSDPDGIFKSFQEGTFVKARVYPNSPGYKDVVAAYPDAVTWTLPGGSTYNVTFNFNRGTFDATSKTTDKQKADTQAAIRNRDFRLAVLFGFDTRSYRAQNVGDEGAGQSLRNTLVPTQFVSIEGQPFGDSVQTKLQALDADAFGDVNLAEGQDAYYNADKAKEYIEKARKALEADGVEFPIHLDIPVDGDVEVGVNQVKSLKSTIEESLGKDNVVVDIQMLSRDQYLQATYQATTGEAGDFDISNASGWGPDYIDPSTYLNIYDSRTGDMLKTLGLEGSAIVQGEDPSVAAKAAIGLEEYDALLDKANAIFDNDDARYEAYAEAEAWLLNAVIQIPVNSNEGLPNVTKVVPFTKPEAWAGLSTDKLKFIKLQEDVVTVDQFDKAFEQWTADKEAAAK